MLNSIGLNKVKLTKKIAPLRSIAKMALYDLDYVKDAYKGGTMTFTGGGLATDIFRHAAFWYTAGHTEQADGSVILKPANNIRRTDLGLWVEQARTNNVLYSRNLTNAAWVKTNMTALKNMTGVDNIANSASSILATAADATILQPITLASSQRFQSAYVKRLTGTGAVYMTMDGGTTWGDITSQIKSSWTRISLPTATLTNPQVGFKISISGDSVAVDFIQNENGNNLSSPRETTTAAVNSFGDRSTAEDSGGAKLSPLPPLLRGGHGFYIEASANRSEQFGLLVSSAGVQTIVNSDGSVNFQTATTPAGQFVRGRYVTNKVAGYINADGSLAICCNGNAVVKATASVLPGLVHMDLGTNGSQVLCMHGNIIRVAFFEANILTDADLLSFTKL